LNISTAAGLRFITTVGLILAVGPALACKGPNVKFTDDFRQMDDSWAANPDTDTVIVEDGNARIKAGPSEGFTVLYRGFIFDDVDFYVTVQLPDLTDHADQLLAGPVFWGEAIITPSRSRQAGWRRSCGASKEGGSMSSTIARLTAL
jgi:hypothetical protein